MCLCVQISFITYAYLTISIHSYFFLPLHWSAFCLNEMHLDIYNFIMPCNNISLCDGKQAERGHTERRAFVWAIWAKTATWHSAGADFILFLCNTDELRWIPGLLLWNPGAPVSKGTPLAPQPSSLAASVSWHRGLQAPLAGPWYWRNPVHSRSSALTDGYMGHQGFCKPVNHLWISHCLDRVHAGRRRKMVLNAFVSVFLSINKDGQLQRKGHEFSVSVAQTL